jgi:hypothetical protein
MPHDELIDLERRAWTALSTEEAAAPFYEEHLADEVLMLLPGGMVVDGRTAVLESMQGPPWDEHELRDERVLPIGNDAAVVAYRARARRGDMVYAALFTSTWVRVGGAWRLTLHQQTPV